jgi:hypothetical protein
MVETTSTQNLINQDIVTHVDRSRVNSFADKWWGNMLAVVKLREKGTTKVSELPSGVFRHLLEYEFPNEFSFRYSEPCGGRIKDKQQHRHFPAIEKLSYDNYLVAVNELPGTS